MGENEKVNYQIVRRNMDSVPKGKGKIGSSKYENMLEDFIKSGDSNWETEYKEKEPSYVTVRGSLQKLTRKGYTSKNSKVIPDGKYYGKVKVSAVKGFIYFERVGWKEGIKSEKKARRSTYK